MNVFLIYSRSLHRKEIINSLNGHDYRSSPLKRSFTQAYMTLYIFLIRQKLIYPYIYIYIYTHKLSIHNMHFKSRMFCNSQMDFQFLLIFIINFYYFHFFLWNRGLRGSGGIKKIIHFITSKNRLQKKNNPDLFFIKCIELLWFSIYLLYRLKINRRIISYIHVFYLLIKNNQKIKSNSYCMSNSSKIYLSLLSSK